jgi:asparagine synthase (glutamine-hydrolysing)
LSIPALREYLALGYVPAPWTLFEGVQKLLPAHYMVLEKGAVRDQAYWELPDGPIEQCAEEEWVERVREKLLESVRVRLVSDVPLGAFLSGGVDSSAIVAAMAQMSDRPVKTYSIGFEGRDSFYNELPYARLVAKAFGTDHHEIIVRPNVSELLPKLIWHLDEPIADSAFITTYLVAQLARESVTVILSGVGGDELFGGYRRYLGSRLRAYYRWVPGTVRNKWLPGILSVLPQDRHSNFKNYLRYADAFVRSANSSATQQYASYITLFSPEVQTAMFQSQEGRHSQGLNGFASATMDRVFRPNPRDGDINQFIYADIKTSLPDDLLALTDRMTMAESIECRAPFIDHEFVELTTRIPEDLKVRGFKMKYLLKSHGCLPIS